MTAALSLLLVSVWMVPAEAAEAADTIRALNAKGNYTGAQSKCQKFGAAGPSAPPELREACAEAFWEAAAEKNTVEAWQAYRQAWKGTSKEQPSLEKEAERALFKLGAEASEDDFLAVSTTYSGTPAAEQARAKAANVAIVRVTDGVAARRVCQTYPEDPRIAELAQKFVVDLVEVKVTDTGVDVTPAECAKSAGIKVTTNWVTRSQGKLSSWDTQAKEWLVKSGLPPEYVQEAAASADGGTALPVCFDANVPQGVDIGVQLVSGKGSGFIKLQVPKSCDANSPPSFLTVEGDRVVGLTLKSGHLMSFPAAKDARPGGLAPLDPGPPILIDDQVAQRLAQGLWLVQPLSGETAWWATSEGQPPGRSLPLTPFTGGALPSGWSYARVGANNAVNTPSGPWTLPAGQPVPLSPMVQRVTGLHRDNPALTEAARPQPLPGSEGGWTVPALGVTPDGGAYGPRGSRPIEVKELDAYGRSNTADALVRAGLQVEVGGAWQVQLDADGPIETVLDAVVEGGGLRLLHDPPEKGYARLYPLELGSPEAATATQRAAFAFEWDGRRYFAMATPLGPGQVMVETLWFGPKGLSREGVRVVAPVQP